MNPFDAETQPPVRTSAGRAPQLYSTFLPFVIVLLTLILATTKDIIILHKRKIDLVRETALAAEPLKKVGQQAEFDDSLRADLVKLAPSDPVAARIVADFFAPPVARKQGEQPEAAPAPPAQAPVVK